MEVILRQRQGKKKIALSLAVWHADGRKWSYESLKLYLYPGKENQERNKETLSLAKTIQAKRQIELQAGEYGLIPAHKRKGDFVDFFARLTDERDRNWRQALRYLKEFTKGATSFQSINEAWLLDLQKFLLKKASVNMAWLIESKIRAGIRLAVKRGRILRDFTANVSPIRFVQKERTFLSIDEIQRLINAPCNSQEIKRAFLFSCFTGLRFSDVRRLTWKNIEADFIRFTQKKTGEPERLPLNQNAKQILFNDSRKVIPLESDHKVFALPTPHHVNVTLREWAKAAGIEKHLTFHVGRHSYAFLLLTSGVDLYDTSKALGHRSVAMTIIYAHLVPEELKKKIDEKLPVFKINGKKA